MASTVVVLSSAILMFIFAKFKMAVSATSVKEINVFKRCCNPLDVSHSATSKENLGPVLDWMIKKKAPSMQKGISMRSGATQVCLLLPVLFLMVLDTIMRKTTEKGK
jgi:hypothetical protein